MLVGVERITVSGSLSRDDCDMFLRLAAAEYHLGHATEWQHALVDAHKAASKVSDPSIRRKLIADTKAVAGSLMRRHEPHRAISYLSSAIDFQETAERALLLPELYLQRGRANRDLGRLDDAQNDFERGIQRLERQRIHTPDVSLRAGIFDDADELFTDAVSLALSRHDAVGAFGYVERGRARAMLEEMSSKEGDKSLARPIAVGALMRALAPGSLLVEYQILEDAIAVIVIDHTRVELIRVPRRREVVEREIQSFIDSLIEYRDKAAIDPASRTLYEWLLKPLQAQLSRARSLILVPDARLQQLPFAALMNGRTGRYLIEDHLLLTAPSASIYAGMRHSMPRRPIVPPSTAALFANPFLRGGPFEDLSPLPASEEEVIRIARMYRRPIVMIGADATVSRFTSIADACDVVHFAGHTLIRPSEPWHSALLFAPDESDGGLLSIQRIARLSFRNTRVVVLASCSTLRGHTAGVEGIPSVARAFLVAGVPAVVGTLWDIDDGESGPLVATLHAGLARGAPAAHALRAAQIEALKSPVVAFRHPSRWAAFVLLSSVKEPFFTPKRQPTDFGHLPGLSSPDGQAYAHPPPSSAMH
ncbi:MAG TPA: CHAT domain-containing protein [Thermoanaerobaculia bacterium]|nr:CHAT domain-containing protein [Thermoanaerobaculia bacterium]